VREIVVSEHEAGQRLDRLLRKLLPNVPLGAIFKALRSGAVRVDGKKAKGALRLASGMTLQLRLPAADLAHLDAPPTAPLPGGAAPAAAGAPLPAELVPRVVWRDEHVLVIDKPSGLAVHGGSGVQHSVADWLAALPFGVRTATFAPAAAHRLDRGTSGLLAIGLTPAALRALTAAFRDGAVDKTYHAVVHGVPEPARGTIDAPLADVPARPNAPKVVADPSGLPARTDYEVVRTLGAPGTRAARALLRVVPHEGRQHQIRAHLAHLGHPIVGDRRYGAPAGSERRLLLHASELAFPHPVTGARVVVEAPLPPDFAVVRGR
jgi:23S rRNA pseudouridine955/2504/2580 synthase